MPASYLGPIAGCAGGCIHGTQTSIRLDDITTQLPGAEMLILHDPADPETPFARSAELAAGRERTEIVPLHDLGHTAGLPTSA